MNIKTIIRPTRELALRFGTEAPTGTPPIIVFGAMGCGKTRNKNILCQMLGCSIVVDDWRPDQPLIPGALHLTQQDPRSNGGKPLLSTVLAYENLVYGEEFL